MEHQISSSDSSSLVSFPFLTSNEFRQGCEALLQRIRDAGGAHDLGWSSVKWTERADSSFILSIVKDCGFPHSQISKGPLQTETEETMSSSINTLEEITEEEEEEEEEGNEDDDEALARCFGTPLVEVKYDIILSSTYQVPVLYLMVPALAQVGITGIEGIYRCLVPPQQRSALKEVGVMGGISFGYHPQSEIPAYFVHPCNTATAMANIVGENGISPEGYLLAWLGLVGNSVNLYVPSRLWRDD